MLTRKEMEDVRSYLMKETRVWGGNISVYENGRFEIRDLTEYEVNSIYSSLMRNCKVHNLYRTHKFSFNQFDYLGRPKVKYTIMGDWE